MYAIRSYYVSQGLGVTAVGETAAGDEEAGTPELLDQRLAAFRTVAPDLLARAFLDLLGVLVEQRLERVPEPAQLVFPLLLAAGNRIERLLEAGGKVVVDVFGKMLGA